MKMQQVSAYQRRAQFKIALGKRHRRLMQAKPGALFVVIGNRYKGSDGQWYLRFAADPVSKR